jgi:hypothetical protein
MILLLNSKKDEYDFNDIKKFEVYFDEYPALSKVNI